MKAMIPYLTGETTGIVDIELRMYLPTCIYIGK